MTKETLARTIALAVVLINQILVAFGFNPLPFDQATTYTYASTIITIVVSLITYWYNNSSTKPAIDADKVLTLLRDGSVTMEEILALTKGKGLDDISETEEN